MSRSANDDRSDRYNPNNDAYWAAEANEAEQRGDDGDDYEPAPASNDPTPTRTRELPLLRRSSWTPAFSDRERCGPLVMDRTSHLLWAIDQIGACFVDHRCESSESVARRAGELRALREVAADVPHAEANGRYANSLKRRSEVVSTGRFGYAEYRDVWVVDETLLARYESTLRACVEWAQSVGYAPAELADADRLSDPELVAVGWRRGLDLFSASFLRMLESEQVGSDEARDDLAATYAVSQELSWRAEEPGVFGCRRMTPDGEMYRWACGADRAPLLQTVGYSGVYDSRGAAVVRILPLLFPATRAEGPPSLSYTSCARVLGALRWMLEPYPDWFDVRPTLEAALSASIDAEWAGTAFCVFGVRTEGRGAVGQTAVWTSCGARSVAAASRQRDALATRGFRAVVLPTPIVGGRTNRFRHDGGHDQPPESPKGAWSLDTRVTWPPSGAWRPSRR